MIAPDPIPAPVRLSEAEAIATLRTIAALASDGQHVNHLMRWPASGTRSRQFGGFDPVWIGLCLVRDPELHDFSKKPRWCWLNDASELRYCRTTEIGGEGVIIPAGRIRPWPRLKMKPGLSASREAAPRPGVILPKIAPYIRAPQQSRKEGLKMATAPDTITKLHQTSIRDEPHHCHCGERMVPVYRWPWRVKTGVTHLHVCPDPACRATWIESEYRA